MKRKNQILNSLKIKRISEYQIVTAYSKPREIGFFSFDENRKLLLNSNQSISVLNSSVQLPLDMNSGYPDDYIKRDAKPEGIVALCDFMESRPENSDFISWRGIMTKIITTPYSTRDDWEILGVRRNGCIYLAEDDRDPALADGKFGENEQQKRFVYYGYKAETMLTKSLDPKRADESSSITNTKVQFCSIFQTKLGAHRLILGGEVDCLAIPVLNQSDYQNEYMEIKTNRLITSETQNRNFVKFKGLKTWAQSYLAGVGKILFAFRDDDGIIKKLQKYDTSSFPRLARKENLWDPNVCLTFGSKVLDFIKDNMSIDDESLIYAIKYDSASREIIISEPFQDSGISALMSCTP